MAKRCVKSTAVTLLSLLMAQTAGCGGAVEIPDRDASMPGTGGTVAFTTPPTASAYAGGSGGASTGTQTADAQCALLGSWDTISQPWNGKSTASVITFANDGTFAGVPTYSGQYTFDGTVLVIWNDSGDGMDCRYDAQWTVRFDTACTTATLIPTYDNCTGERRYLDWNVQLLRH